MLSRFLGIKGLLAPVLTSAPAPLITWAELDQHLRLDGDMDQQVYVAALAEAATAYLDGWTGILGGRALVAQSWRQDFPRFPCASYPLTYDLGASALRLALFPVTALSGITYFDADGVAQTLDPDRFRIQADALGAAIASVDIPYTWPSTACRLDAVSVTYVAGYGTPAAVPAPLKAAVLLLVGHWYQNREAVNVGNLVSEMPLAVRDLIAPYRRIGI